jgi:hypothetical protein
MILLKFNHALFNKPLLNHALFKRNRAFQVAPMELEQMARKQEMVRHQSTRNSSKTRL